MHIHNTHTQPYNHTHTHTHTHLMHTHAHTFTHTHTHARIHTHTSHTKHTHTQSFYKQKGPRVSTRLEEIPETFESCMDSLIERCHIYHTQAEEYRNDCIEGVWGVCVCVCACVHVCVWCCVGDG